MESRTAWGFEFAHEALGVAVGADYLVGAFDGGDQQSQDLQVAPH